MWSVNVLDLLMPKKMLPLDTSLKKLENYAEKLESNDIPLEESLKLFEESMKIVMHCETQLKDAELKIKQVIENAQGEVSEIPFDGKDE